MFWANMYTLSPHIEALLQKEDVSLQELMDQDDIIPECKSQNKKLIEYLSRPEIMNELVTLTTKEPPIDMDERSRYKYPNVACELLTCNVRSLSEKLAGDETLLAKLYSFMDTDETLNPLLASFFSKTIGVLLTRQSDQNWYSYQFICFHVLEFLKSRKNCVDQLLQHLETSAIMDLVLKLVTKVDGGDMRQNVLNWLDSEQLVQRLIKLLSPTSEPERHANAAQLLCDMIKLARCYRISCTERTEPDPIFNTLESEEAVSLLLDTILTDELLESSIVGGIQVLLVLLGHEPNKVGNENDAQGNRIGEEATDDENRVKIQNATVPYLEMLQKLLLNPPPKPPVKTTAGLLTSPLGNTRLHIAKLLVALLHNDNIDIFRRLAQLETFQILLDLFFKYSWNNFLHTQVEQCLGSVINGDWQENSEFVYSHIFVECKLTNRLLDAWNQNQNTQNKETSIRQGYMGHLINIVNNIVNQCKKNQVLDEYLKTNPSPECAKQWEELVTTELVEINKFQELELGGKPQPYMTGSEEASDEYNSYGQDVYVQQSYANYQGQQMTQNFIEHCGFHDDEFNDRDDALHHCMLSNSIDQLTTMPFTLNEEDLDKGEDMFNKICQQKQKAGLDESGGAVEWGDEGELTFQTVIDKRDWPSKQQHHDSNSSDEDEDPREMNMEPDSTDPWGSTEQFSNVLPTVNPWDITSSESSEYTGWANFDNFENTHGMTETLKIEEILPPDSDEAAAGNTEPKNSTVDASTSNQSIPMEEASISVESVKSKTPMPAVAVNSESPQLSANDPVEYSITSMMEVLTITEQSQKAEISEAPARIKKNVHVESSSLTEFQNNPEASSNNDKLSKVELTTTIPEKSLMNVEVKTEKSSNAEITSEKTTKAEITSEILMKADIIEKPEKLVHAVEIVQHTVEQPSNATAVPAEVHEDLKNPVESIKVDGKSDEPDKPQTML